MNYTPPAYCDTDELISQGRVVSIADGTVQVQGPDGEIARARVAIPGGRLEPGDSVVMIGRVPSRFVVGVLTNSAPAVIRTNSGTTAVANGDILAVHDERGVLIFEYDSKNGKTTVRPNGTDLELAARGTIRLCAGENVHIEGERTTLHGRSWAGIIQGQLTESCRTALLVSSRGIQLLGRQLRLHAKQSTLELGDTTIAASGLRVRSKRASVEAEHAEVRVGTLRLRAQNIYRRIEELAETFAGRVRTLVRGDWSVHSDRASLKSDKEVQIDGSKIHLG
ncbi:MAG: DUF3540 domain-containing protein [Planctomycetota bacterium]